MYSPHRKVKLMVPDVKGFEALAERASTRDVHGHTTQTNAARHKRQLTTHPLHFDRQAEGSGHLIEHVRHGRSECTLLD